MCRATRHPARAEPLGKCWVRSCYAQSVPMLIVSNDTASSILNDNMAANDECSIKCVDDIFHPREQTVGPASRLFSVCRFWLWLGLGFTIELVLILTKCFAYHGAMFTICSLNSHACTILH